MLGNRALGWKFLIALGVVIAACAWSHRRGEEINPAYWICTLKPGKYDGRKMWVPTLTVGEVDADGFTYKDQSFRIRVHGVVPVHIEEGDTVGIVATFNADGTLDLINIEKQHPLPSWRLIVNLISIASLIFVIWYFLRAFRIRWDRLSLRQKNG